MESFFLREKDDIYYVLIDNEKMPHTINIKNGEITSFKIKKLKIQNISEYFPKNETQILVNGRKLFILTRDSFVPSVEEMFFAFFIAGFSSDKEFLSKQGNISSFFQFLVYMRVYVKQMNARKWESPLAYYCDDFLNKTERKFEWNEEYEFLFNFGVNYVSDTNFERGYSYSIQEFFESQEKFKKIRFKFNDDVFVRFIEGKRKGSDPYSIFIAACIDDAKVNEVAGILKKYKKNVIRDDVQTIFNIIMNSEKFNGENLKPLIYIVCPNIEPRDKREELQAVKDDLRTVLLKRGYEKDELHYMLSILKENGSERTVDEFLPKKDIEEKNKLKDIQNHLLLICKTLDEYIKILNFLSLAAEKGFDTTSFFDNDGTNAKLLNIFKVLYTEIRKRLLDVEFLLNGKEKVAFSDVKKELSDYNNFPEEKLEINKIINAAIVSKGNIVEFYNNLKSKADVKKYEKYRNIYETILNNGKQKLYKIKWENFSISGTYPKFEL